MVDLKSDKYIYKYVGINMNTLKMLIKGELWFGKLDNFNDPFDGEFNIGNIGGSHDARNEFFRKKFGDHVIDRYFKKGNEDDFRINHYMKNFINKEFKEKLGICCFSKIPDNDLMWSHYANGHTGLCLIFNKEKLLNSLQYGVKKKEIGVVEFGDDNYVESLCNIDLNFTDKDNCEGNFDDFFKKKKNDWSYEQEIRLYYMFRKDYSNRLLQFHKESLAGIIFGYKTDEDDIYTIDTLVREMGYDEYMTPYNMRFERNKGSVIYPGVPFTVTYKHDFKYPYAQRFGKGAWLSVIEYEDLIERNKSNKA